MKDNIVGIIAGATVDHLLVDAQLHKTLCGKHIKGKVICEVQRGRIPLGQSLQDVLTVWSQSTRQCSWCVKKMAKRQAEAEK